MESGRRRQVLWILFAIILTINLFADADSLISRCRTVLQEDITLFETRQVIISLIKEIEDKEELYLKSALYPDVRQKYEEMQARLGEYYFKEENFKIALGHYTEADKYSEYGYRDRIEECRKHLGLSKPDIKEHEIDKPAVIDPVITPKPPLSTALMTSWYNKIVKLWKKVRILNDERQAVSYVVRSVSLKTTKNKAYTKLDAIRDRWIKYFKPDLNASANLMLSELYARTDNPKWQSSALKDVVNYLNAFRKNHISLPGGVNFSKQQILNTKLNVDRFRLLKDCYLQPPKNRSELSKVNDLVKTIAYDYLTPAHQIKAYYMRGILLNLTYDYTGASFHLYNAMRLMEVHRLLKVEIVWNSHSASRGPTIKLLADNFRMVKNNSSLEREFKRVYGEGCFSEIDQITEKYIEKQEGGKGMKWWVIALIIIGILILIGIIIAVVIENG